MNHIFHFFRLTKKIVLNCIMKSKEGAFFFLSTLFLLSSLAFNAVFFNIAKFKPDVSTSHSINNGVHFDFLDEAKAPLVKGFK